MKTHALFVFHFPSSKHASVVITALSPEIIHKIPKSTVAVSQDGTIMRLTVDADDVSSLRAACNSYLRWIQTALAVEDLV
jgi:tRNA threonylcarbamoyladenosine modification (KEOPS) complex  Pcc1 subunit